MPNWCSNQLIITGPANTINSFVSKAKGRQQRYKEHTLSFTPERIDVFSFHSLYPVPQEILEAGFDPVGYEWEVAHWGCKWGCPEGADLTIINPDHVEYTFETPWAPPVRFLEKVSKDYPQLRFQLMYFEPGIGFKGVIVWENGLRVDAWEDPVTENDKKELDNDHDDKNEE